MFIILFVSLDEFHQYLTGGRIPRLQDVVLDTIGGLIAIGLYTCYRMLWSGKYQSKIRK
jgi:VanZ family protein